MKKMMFALALLVVGLGASAPKAYAVGDFSSGNWRGYAVIENGRFSLCRMSANYSNNYSLVFGITGDGNLLFALANSTWNLNVGNRPEMRLQIDRGPALVREGRIIDRITVAMFMTDRDSIYNQVRYGSNIRVSVGTATESFTLQGTYNALQSLLACAARYR
jgi:hypothetical protein